jgi:hypothetical protein
VETLCLSKQGYLDPWLLLEAKRVHEQKHLGNTGLSIKKVVFQGDSFSLVWFCLALNPMLLLLNTSEIGYKFNMQNKWRLSHLL